MSEFEECESALIKWYPPIVRMSKIGGWYIPYELNHTPKQIDFRFITGGTDDFNIGFHELWNCRRAMVCIAESRMVKELCKTMRFYRQFKLHNYVSNVQNNPYTNLHFDSVEFMYFKIFNESTESN